LLSQQREVAGVSVELIQVPPETWKKYKNGSLTTQNHLLSVALAAEERIKTIKKTIVMHLKPPLKTTQLTK